MTFAYAQRRAWVGPLSEVQEPQAYDLCADHAQRTRAPSGWLLDDQRWVAEHTAPSGPRGGDAGTSQTSPEAAEVTQAAQAGGAPDGQRTVDILAAALRAAGRAGSDGAKRDAAGSRARHFAPAAEADVPEELPSPILGHAPPGATACADDVSDDAQARLFTCDLEAAESVRP